MKRIIDGVTYNTDTSTRLARSEYETAYNHEDRHCEGDLYQTRGGAFFVWETIYLDGVDDDGEPRTRDRFVALSAKEAEKWIMTGDVEVFHNPFGEPPEAEAEAEPGATIYLRVPAALKKRVDAAAANANLSGNAWAIRCLENCLSA
jgi:predicted HicB family RNase H-like nuclease